MFCVKAGARLQVQIGSTISFFMQFIQINFKVSDKAEGEDIHCSLQAGDVKRGLN